MLTVGSLFSGIGLLDYGLHLAGLHHAWLCESDPWRRSILEQRWPGVPIFDDVRAVGTRSAERVDVLAGGFPCKGVSTLVDRASRSRNPREDRPMCNVSMIMDTYRPHIPVVWPPNTASVPQQWKIGGQPAVQPKDNEELRELIESFKEAVRAATAFDRLTNQPDCVDPEKAKLEERVAELERKLDEMAKAAGGVD